MPETAFEKTKREAIRANEESFGAEARALWGDGRVDAANAARLSMDEEAWKDMDALEAKIKELLAAALATGDVESEEAHELADAHARWIAQHWGEAAYSPEAHRNLADTYVSDERFRAYYDSPCGEGAARFLRDSIHRWVA